MKISEKEKVIKFLKENKKVKRIDFWNFLKDIQDNVRLKYADLIMFS